MPKTLPLMELLLTYATTLLPNTPVFKLKEVWQELYSTLVTATICLQFYLICFVFSFEKTLHKKKKKRKRERKKWLLIIIFINNSIAMIASYCSYCSVLLLEFQFQFAIQLFLHKYWFKFRHTILNCRESVVKFAHSIWYSLQLRCIHCGNIITLYTE